MAVELSSATIFAFWLVRCNEKPSERLSKICQKLIKNFVVTVKHSEGYSILLLKNDILSKRYDLMQVCLPFFQSTVPRLIMKATFCLDRPMCRFSRFTVEFLKSVDVDTNISNVIGSCGFPGWCGYHSSPLHGCQSFLVLGSPGSLVLAVFLVQDSGGPGCVHRGQTREICKKQEHYFKGKVVNFTVQSLLLYQYVVDLLTYLELY